MLDPAFLAWVRTLACSMRAEACSTPCEGRVEADHVGPRPYGRKCSDREAVPMCQKHHRERTDARGHFAGWSKEQMRTWAARAVERTLARWSPWRQALVAGAVGQGG